MKIIDVNAIAFLPNFLNAYMVYTLKSSLLTMKMMKKEKNQMKGRTNEENNRNRRQNGTTNSNAIILMFTDLVPFRN